MPSITGDFLVVQGVQAGKHLTESKLKLLFCLCEQVHGESREDQCTIWAVWGIQLESYCCPLFPPAACLEPQLFHFWMGQRVFFVPLLFSWAEGCHSHPKCIFPSFCAQQKFLILCTVMEYHQTVITLPWKRGSLEGLCSVFPCWWTLADKAEGWKNYSAFLKR